MIAAPRTRVAKAGVAKSSIAFRAAVSVVAIVVGGCGTNSTSSAGGGGEKATGAADVPLKILALKEFQDTIASHAGKKVVVVDYWSTSCEPCKKEFPGLVALAEKHPDDVVCVSVSVDFEGGKGKAPEDKAAGVKAFLAAQKASRVFNVLSATPSDDVMKAIDLVAPPAVYVYGRDGKLAKKFDNDSAASEKEYFTYADVGKLVAELIAKK